MSIPKEEVGSLPHYLQRIEELYTGNYSVLFRGQQCDDWDLVPRIGRTKFRKRFPSLLETEKRSLKSLIVFLFHISAIETFPLLGID